MFKLHEFACTLGAIMLAVGVCSPMMTVYVNSYSSIMTIGGVLLMAIGFINDSQKDNRKEGRR